MTNVIENNAYRILGLDTNANQKDILKRYKEIINRLKIDDLPTYDLDLGSPDKFRKEDEVNNALKQLQSQKNKITEYFFWFYINDKNDGKVLNYLKNEEFLKVIQLWKKVTETKNSTSLLYKKNLALLYCLLLIKEHNQEYLEKSLSLWKEIIDSDKFWIAFEKAYALNNEQTTSSEVFSEFKKSIVNKISDAYVDFQKYNKKSSYMKSFQVIFGTHGEKTEKKISNPLFEAVHEKIKELQQLKSEEEKIKDKCDNCGDTEARKYKRFENGKILCDKCNKLGKTKMQIFFHAVSSALSSSPDEEESKIKRIDYIISSIDNDFKKLEKIKLQDEDKIKVVRDRAAEAIRELSVSLHNFGDPYNNSTELLKQAIKICGTNSLKDHYENELKHVKEIGLNDKKNIPIIHISQDESIEFRTGFLKHYHKKIFYKDIGSISYQAVTTTNTVYGIQTSSSTEYSFEISSYDKSISLKLSNEETWHKLINLSKQIVEPFIIAKIVKRIFEENEPYSIGEVTFDKTGYHKSKFFGGDESFHWDEEKWFIPQFQQGSIFLFTKEHGKAKQLAAISMAEPNAVVIPELLEACFNEYALRNGK